MNINFLNVLIVSLILLAMFLKNDAAPEWVPLKSWPTCDKAKTPYSCLTGMGNLGDCLCCETNKCTPEQTPRNNITCPKSYCYSDEKLCMCCFDDCSNPPK
ncbi:Hypothetical protein CINCED_3A024187 [Cinara cedri]|nr:Hypothetical protein CINCED_3A024187 [Cinara cedri]